MPLLETTASPVDNAALLLCTMLWPGAAGALERDQFRAIWDARLLLRGRTRGDVVEISAEHLETLLDAPSWASLSAEMERRGKRAMMAGYVFATVFLLDYCRANLPARIATGASLNKATAAAAGWAKSDGLFGDGTRMPSSTVIKECWAEFGTVAHLWAAKLLNQAFPRYPVNQDFEEQNVSAFLQSAAYLQMFGANHRLEDKSKRRRDSLLDPATGWTVDIARHRPALMLCDPADLFDAPFLLALKRYAA